MGHAGKAYAVAAALAAGMLSASGATPPEKLQPCLARHGAEGRSETATVPSLGAQPSTYTLIQLFMFRERLRLSEPMNAVAKALSDDDLQSMAGSIAALPPPEPPADPGDAARLDRARALIEQNHCNICHRADSSGQENVPHPGGPAGGLSAQDRARLQERCTPRLRRNNGRGLAAHQRR
jgi:cytochrome c553